MSLYVVEYAYAAGSASARQEVRPDHAQYLAELERAGVLVLSGPYTDGTGALFLVRAGDDGECRTCFDADPFWRAGLVEGRAFHQFLVGFGLPDELECVARPPARN